MKRTKQAGMSAAAFWAGYSNPIGTRSTQPATVTATVLVPECWRVPVCPDCQQPSVAVRTKRGIEHQHACKSGRAS